MRRPSIVLFALLAGLTAGSARVPAAAPATIVIASDRPGASIAKTMVGVFFEDINFAADGGLYPERVKNRSFEFPDSLMGWQRAVPGAGTFEVRTDGAPGPHNPHYMRLQATDAEVMQEPTDQPWGTRDCAFRDPSGNMIRIKQA